MDINNRSLVEVRMFYSPFGEHFGNMHQKDTYSLALHHSFRKGIFEEVLIRNMLKDVYIKESKYY